MKSLRIYNGLRLSRIRQKQSRRGIANGLVVAAVVIVGCAVIWLVFGAGTGEAAKADQSSEIPQVEKRRYPVTINKPPGPPRVLTGLSNVHGDSVTVSCSTCHITRAPNFENKSVADLDEFHSGLAFSHGSVSCLSCHNSEDYDALKLADGTRIEFSDVMTLCGQCHGPQLKDYEHGTHGGMNGFWDLTRGPQTKNNCVDCHKPHAPQFPKMKPTFKPRDRFLDPEGEH